MKKEPITSLLKFTKNIYFAFSTAFGLQTFPPISFLQQLRTAIKIVIKTNNICILVIFSISSLIVL